MKFSHALILASSLAFFACGGDDDSPSGPSAPTSVSSSSVPGSSSSGQSSPAYDCSVSNGIKVVSPAGGETFKVGEEITVVFGTDIVDASYRIGFKNRSSGVQALDLTDDGSVDAVMDGKTCNVYKIKLSADYGVEPTETGFIRITPYNKQNKGADSKSFIVKE